MTLPGMPLQAGDPGVFVCGPDDIAPWERERPARRRLAVVAPGDAPTGVWLVLTRCDRCARIRAYCPSHRLDWLFAGRS